MIDANVIAASAALVAALSAVSGAIRTFMNSSKIQEIHMTMNSRLDQLLNASVAQARSEGHAQGIAEAVIDPAVTATAAAKVIETAKAAMGTTTVITHNPSVAETLKIVDVPLK
jgi:hypothetical protein